MSISMTVLRIQQRRYPLLCFRIQQCRYQWLSFRIQ